MKMEKIVGAIVWIPLQLPAVFAVVCSNFWVAMLPCWPDYDYGYCYSASSFVGFYETMAVVFLSEIIVVAIVGEVILIRHDFGSEKFKSLFKKWYLVFVVLYMAVVIFVCFTCGIGWSLRVLSQSIVHCLYPVFSLAELMLVIAIARGIKKNGSQD
jgi:hypothetical protein